MVIVEEEKKKVSSLEQAVEVAEGRGPAVGPTPPGQFDSGANWVLVDAPSSREFIKGPHSVSLSNFFPLGVATTREGNAPSLTFRFLPAVK